MQKWHVTVRAPSGRTLGYICEAESEDEAKTKAARFMEGLMQSPTERGARLAAALGSPDEAPFTFVR